MFLSIYQSDSVFVPIGMTVLKQLASITVLILLLPVSSTSAKSLDEEYRDVAARLIGAALLDEGGWEKLSYLTTRIGHRLSGSPQLEHSLQWIAQRMRADGLDNVRLQPVKIPHWERGRESAKLIAPVEKSLSILGLGSSVGTRPEGITAPVIAVRSFDELEALGSAKIRGKIVLYDPEWKRRGGSSLYRNTGPARAAKLGAVAALIRPTVGFILYSPHTGNTDYVPGVPQIPAAGIAFEDAALIRKLLDSGDEVKICLKMEARTLPDADSANVMGEIVGRELPDEVVVLGGHIDSWDVGQGAHDDAGGVISAWQAVYLIKKLGLKPRRTVRAVGWTNEENGARGGQKYRDEIAARQKHVAAIEMDDGVERPLGFRFDLKNAEPKDPAYRFAQEKLEQIVRLLAGIGVDKITPGSAGTDIGPLMLDGIPSLGLFTSQEHYFDWHHTQADTLDKVDPQDLRRCTAALAVLAYVLAEMPERLTH